MSELTDDQLDGLFRKSAEEFDPPFDQAAWQDMKIRLDKHDLPVPSGTPLWKNLLRWGLPVCLLLLLMVGGLYTYRGGLSSKNAASAPATTGSLTNTIPKSDATASAISTNRSVKSRLTQTGSTQSTPTDLSAPSIDRNSQPTAPETLAKERESAKSSNETDVRILSSNVKATGKIVTPEVARITAEKKRASTKTNNPDKATRVKPATRETVASRPAGNPDIGSINEPRIGKETTGRYTTRKQVRTTRVSSPNPFVTANDAMMVMPSFRNQPLRKTFQTPRSTGSTTTETVTQPRRDLADAAGFPEVSKLGIRPARWPKALKFTGRDIEEKQDTVAYYEKPKPPVERGLSIRFAVAPDLSSVGLKNFTRPGTNVGVLLEYRLASRWSVQVGIIQSTKIYKASPSEYTAPPGSWSSTMGTPPTSIDGQCNMFDIPINLRYDVSLRPRKSGLSPDKWFISGGLTSYYIKQEDYVYNYSGYVHMPPTPYSGSTGGYGFSQLNLSAGYERAISRRLSWQVEPFLKIPLKGVGYYKIDLLSTGAFFSIRYKL